MAAEGCTFLCYSLTSPLSLSQSLVGVAAVRHHHWTTWTINRRVFHFLPVIDYNQNHHATKKFSHRLSLGLKNKTLYTLSWISSKGPFMYIPSADRALDVGQALSWYVRAKGSPSYTDICKAINGWSHSVASLHFLILHREACRFSTRATRVWQQRSSKKGEGAM